MSETPMPAVDGPTMAAIDRAMMEGLGLDVLQVMEVAGRAVAVFARERFLGGDPRGKRVAVLCGSGGNGGDGLVAARYLHAWGAAVTVLLGRGPTPGHGVAAHQLAVLERIALPARPPSPAPAIPASELVIDALLGFSLNGAPAGETAALIRAANAQGAPVLAVDLPSGLDATTGTVFEPCIRATATLTLALPKTGLLAPGAAVVSGEIVVADIGVLPEAYARVGLDPGPLFATGQFRPLSS